MGKGFKLTLLSLLTTSMFLTACGSSNNEKDTENNDTVKFIENTKKSEAEKMKTIKIMVGSSCSQQSFMITKQYGHSFHNFQ